jgi:hypothetical protein
VLSQLRRNLEYLKQIGYEAFHFFTGDCILTDSDVDVLNKLDVVLEKTNKKAYFEDLCPKEFYGYQTLYFYSHIDFYLKVIPNYTKESWINERVRTSNLSLEELFLIKFSPYKDEMLVTKQESEYDIKLDVFKNSNDTFDIVNTEDHNKYFVAWNNESNEFELIISGYQYDCGEVKCNDLSFRYEIQPKNWLRQGIGKEPFTLSVSSNLNTFELHVTNENAQKLKDSCYFTDQIGDILLKKNRKKIKVVHIQTTNNDEREQASRASLERVKDYGWEYVLHQNEPYKSLPPAHTCLRPECVSMELFDEETANRVGTALTPAHYGCFEAFKLAVLTEFHDCDYLMVCEGDCLIEVPIEKFINTVEDSIPIMNSVNIGYMSFGDKALLESGWLQSPVVEDVAHQSLLYITNNVIGIQCIMFPIETAAYMKEQFRTHKWDTADYFFSMIFRNSQWKIGILHNRITTQLDGFSLIDQTNKTFIK